MLHRIVNDGVELDGIADDEVVLDRIVNGGVVLVGIMNNEIVFH